MSQNKEHKFDAFVNREVEQVEYAYDAGHWSSIAAQLAHEAAPADRKFIGMKRYWWIGALVVAFGLLTYVFLSNQPSPDVERQPAYSSPIETELPTESSTAAVSIDEENMMPTPKKEEVRRSQAVEVEAQKRKMTSAVLMLTNRAKQMDVSTAFHQPSTTDLQELANSIKYTYQVDTTGKADLFLAW